MDLKHLFATSRRRIARACTIDDISTHSLNTIGADAKHMIKAWIDDSNRALRVKFPAV